MNSSFSLSLLIPLSLSLSPYFHSLSDTLTACSSEKQSTDCFRQIADFAGQCRSLSPNSLKSRFGNQPTFLSPDMIYPSLCFVLVIIVLGNFMNFAFASDHAFNDNLVRQCLNSNLSSVRISQIELSPFILCENSPIFVRLKEVNLEGLDSIKLLKPPQLSLSGK